MMDGMLVFLVDKFAPDYLLEFAQPSLDEVRILVGDDIKMLGQGVLDDPLTRATYCQVWVSKIDDDVTKLCNRGAAMWLFSYHPAGDTQRRRFTPYGAELTGKMIVLLDSACIPNVSPDLIARYHSAALEDVIQ